MNHEHAAPWILDMHTGRLEPDRVPEVSAHARGCDDCQKVLSVYDALVAAMSSGVATAGGHPGVDDLVQYAMRQPSVEPGLRDRIDGHLADCTTCAEEVAAVRSAEDTAAGSISRGSVVAFPVRRLRYVAAGLAAALVLAVGYIGLVQQDGRPGGIQSPGAVSLPLFSGALRSGAAMPAIEIAREAATVPIAVAPTLPRDTSDAAPLLFEIVSGGDAVFSFELSAAEVRRLSAGSGVMAVIVPSRVLAEGDHLLTLRDRQRDLLLLEQRFSVSRVAP